MYEELKPSRTFDNRQNKNIPSLKLNNLLSRNDSNGNLSHRSNGVQSQFLNTLTSATTIRSARDIQNQVNFENTQELKAFTTIDITQINRDRSDQLKTALEENVKEKESELTKIQNTYNQHKEEYENISLRYRGKNQELEEEIQKQKNMVIDLKQAIRQQEKILMEKEDQHNNEIQQIQQDKNEQQIKLKDNKDQLSKLQQKEEFLRMQKKSYQMNVEIQKKVKSQELDYKLLPLQNERDKVQDNLNKVQESLEMLRGYMEQTNNERNMIQEDLQVSETIKVDLVFQREELESYIETLTTENEDIYFIQQNQLSHQNWDDIKINLIQHKEKQLLLNLIRELQQYILGISSNTTDNSVMQSEDLEDVQYMLQKDKINNQDAIQMIVEFAQNKIKLNINNDSLEKKISQVRDGLDFTIIEQGLSEIQKFSQEIQKLDQRIKVVDNRCCNELRPQLKAVRNLNLITNLIQLDKSEEMLFTDYEQTRNQLTDLQSYFQQLEQEIQNVNNDFQDNYSTKLQEIQEIEANLDKTIEEIQNMEYEIDSHKSIISQTEQFLIDLEQKLKTQQKGYDEEVWILKQNLKYKKEELKKQQIQQNQQEQCPVINQLSNLVAQLKCDKESANKRFKYVENKLKSAEDSLDHAKNVLENHQLQAQQEQLNTKTGYGFKRSSNTNQIQRNDSNTRISMIEQKSSSFARGKILSPTKDNDSPIQSSKYNSTIKSKHTYQQIEDERMHNHYTDKKSERSVQQSSAKKSIIMNSNQKQLQNNKSTIDVVRYYYESCSQNSSEETSLRKNETNSQGVPCQSLITPREALQQLPDNKHQNNYIYETQQTLKSTSSQATLNSYEYNAQRKNSISGNESANSYLTINNNHYLKNQRQTLKSVNSSFDGKQVKNVVIPLYSQFKENILPNQQSLNIKRLSQATNLSTINKSSNTSTVSNRPPAVPQSKASQEKRASRESSQKKAAYQQIIMGSRNMPNYQYTNKSRNEELQIQQPQKIKLAMNIKNQNGKKPIQIGMVDFAKCQSYQKDQAFFQNIKPLIEGAQFLMQSDQQMVLKQMYLDFTLLRIHIDNYNGEKESIMIEDIIKPELPVTTLEQIRQEKNQNQKSSNNRYEFNLIINTHNNQYQQRIQLMAINYNELRQWIVGINAMVANKTNLTRLASLIQY